MRLIDAENFSEAMKDYFTDMITNHKYNVNCVDCNADLQHLLDNQQTAYDVDKLIEKLSDIAIERYGNDGGMGGEMVVNLDDAIEIVKAGLAVEDDVCEWESVSNGEFIQNPHTKRLYSNEPSMQNVYCNACGKKIKVVEQWRD